jgi:hypothetical protein
MNLSLLHGTGFLYSFHSVIILYTVPCQRCAGFISSHCMRESVDFLPRSLSQLCLVYRLGERNTEGKWVGDGDKKRNILFVIFPPGVRFLSPLTPLWKLTCTLQLHYEKLKNTVSVPQVVRERCWVPRGKLVYILITAEYKLNINFRPDEIFWNSSSMYISQQSFLLFFNISFSLVI